MCHTSTDDVHGAVPAILDEAIPATTQCLENELMETTQLAHKYTGNEHIVQLIAVCTVVSVLSTPAVIEHASKGGYRQEVHKAIDLIKQAAINCRQYELFVRMLQVGVELYKESAVFLYCLALG